MPSRMKCHAGRQKFVERISRVDRRISHRPYRRRSGCSECPRRAGRECLQAFLFGATIRRSRPRRRRAARRARCARPGRSVPAGSCNAPKRCRRAQVRCRRPKPPSGCRTALQSRSAAAGARGAAGRHRRRRRPSGGGCGGDGGGALAGTSAASVAGAAPLQFAASMRARRQRRCGRGGRRPRWQCRPGGSASSSARSRSSRRRTSAEFESATKRDNGDHRNRQCGKQQHVEEVVHRSPHCADRGSI